MQSHNAQHRSGYIMFAKANYYQCPEPFALGYYIKCTYDDNLSYYRSHRGADCIELNSTLDAAAAENERRR